MVLGILFLKKNLSSFYPVLFPHIGAFFCKNLLNMFSVSFNVYVLYRARMFQ